MPKYRFVIFVSLLLAAFTGFGQNSIEKIILKADLVYDENPAESYSLYERAEKEAANSDSHDFDGDIHFGKARYLLLIAKYDAAMSEMNKAILIFEKNQQIEKLASVYAIKAILLERLGDERAAHAILLRALEMDKKANNRFGMRARYGNLALDYYRFGEVDSMLYCLQELEPLLEKSEPKSYYFYYQNWGMYFDLKKDFNRAIQQYFLALEVAENQKMTDNKATILMLIAQANRQNGDLTKAEEFATKSYEFSEQNNLNYESSEALLELIAIHEAQGNFAKAYEVQKKWVRIDKEINDSERMQKAQIIENQLDILEKEKEIALGEAALQAEKLESQTIRTRNAWLIGVVIIIIILLIFTALIYAKTKRLNVEINEQKSQVELKSLRLEEALTSIEDSLNYSKLIQESMLPSLGQLSASFKDYFVLYKPKDIVSGDFYWVNESSDSLIFAVGDCTGHGVPGAMVSMVCHEALNKVVKEKGVDTPSLILDEVSQIIAKTFEGSERNLNDGMDISICKIHKNIVEFAGANNPLWVVRKTNGKHIEETKEGSNYVYRDTTLIVLKGDNQAIGRNESPYPFTNHTLELKSSDELFLFSDGYADQFGGEKGKKFKASNLKELLCKLNTLPGNEQHKVLDQNFEDWKGNLEQVDDVCLMGLKY